MIRKMTFMAALTALVWLGGVSAAQAASVSVKVTNLTGGIYFTPLLVTAHDSSTHLFQPGTAASASLRAMAECGSLTALVSDVGGADADTAENPNGGVLAPGGSTTASLTTGSGNTHLSLVAMLLPTNDGFVGLDALEIPTTAGTYTYTAYAWDAGTEANSELMDTSGCAVGMAGIPADPTGSAGTGGTGSASADNNTDVHLHPGNLGDANATGGTSDLDNTVHRFLNPVAKVVVTVQ